jgi:phosphomethylpyrimidine synthase
MSGTSRNQLRVDSDALAGITRGPLPGSSKVYIEGRIHPQLRVPFREIAQTPTRLATGGERPNPSFFTYDSSGPYTDPTASIDLRMGLSPIRDVWIGARDDTVVLPSVSSHYGRQRFQDHRLDALRFPAQQRPRTARSGANVTQMHYARKGVVTPEMEFVAIREMQRADA